MKLKAEGKPGNTIVDCQAGHLARCGAVFCAAMHVLSHRRFQNVPVTRTHTHSHTHKDLNPCRPTFQTWVGCTIHVVMHDLWKRCLCKLESDSDDTGEGCGRHGIAPLGSLATLAHPHSHLLQAMRVDGPETSRTWNIPVGSNVKLCLFVLSIDGAPIQRFCC